MKLPDLSAYRQVKLHKYGAYSCVVWQNRHTDPASESQLSACAFRLGEQETDGKCVEIGKKVQKTGTLCEKQTKNKEKCFGELGVKRCDRA